jgi:hypothetical protein
MEDQRALRRKAVLHYTRSLLLSTFKLEQCLTFTGVLYTTVLAFGKTARLYQFVDRVQKEDPHGEEQERGQRPKNGFHLTHFFKNLKCVTK